MIQFKACFYTVGILVFLTHGLSHGTIVAPKLSAGIDRPWIGADFWSNPMEDWQLRDSIAENTHSGGDRELVLLSGTLQDQRGEFNISAEFIPKSLKSNHGFVGFQIGIRGEFADYRDSAIYGQGFAAGLDAKGHLFIGDRRSLKEVEQAFSKPITLRLTAAPEDGGHYQLKLAAIRENQEIGSFVHRNVHPSWLHGLVSFTVSNEPPRHGSISEKRPRKVPAPAQNRGGDWRFGIRNMQLGGSKVQAKPEQRFGPILWSQHSLQQGTLVMTAQFAPVESGRPAKLHLGDMQPVEAAIDPAARVARFVVSGIDPALAQPYRIEWGEDVFSGQIRPEPTTKNQLRVVAMSCNDSTGFPHQTLVENVTAQMPDLVAFLGDQIYERIGGYGLLFGKDNQTDDDRAILCYLRKYYMHGWTWRDLLRDTPSITLPDDHDVFHGNIWGCGGKLADRSVNLYAAAQDSGGYKMSTGFVNAVHLTQVGNLPAPVDPTPCESGISVYFTSWQYAGIDMAILADRQFKSAPRALLPESKIHNGWPQNHAKQRPELSQPRELSVDGAELLGKRQEAFLARWAKAKNDRSQWRLVFSQTPLMCLQSLPADAYSDSVVPSLPRMKLGQYPTGDIPKLDYDSNGWPQKRRDYAVKLLASARALHITGDQHLGSSGQYGVDDWDDGGWWISSPAIANVWPRRWFPENGGSNRRDDDPKFTGRFEDGFGNRITLHAVANPYDIEREPARLFDKAVGYSVVTLDRKKGHLTLANWPYSSGPELAAPDNQPYPGWPIVIDPATQSRVR